MRSWSSSRRLPLTSPKPWWDRCWSVMIEGKVADEPAYVGRTYMDAPNVDGLIFVNSG